MRKVNKRALLTTIITTLALLMMLFGVLSVSAEGADTQVTATTSASVKQGESGTCFVYIDSLESLSSLIVTIYCDSGKIVISDGGAFNTAPSLLYDKRVNADSVQFSYIFDGNGNAEKTQLFYFEYTALGTAEGGETYFDIVVSEAYDASLNAISIVGSRCSFPILSNPTTVSHSYTRQVVDDAYKKSDATCTAAAIYYYCCDTCDIKGEATFSYGVALGHTGGVATCTEKAKCERCHLYYGLVVDHVYTNEMPIAAYLKSEATCTNRAVYYKSCAYCGKSSTTTFEYGLTKEHSYIEKIDEMYLKSVATSTSNAVYYKSCSTCGLRGTDLFEIGAKPSHSYKTAWDSDATSHWHSCVECGDIKDKNNHTYSNACDEECDICGYARTITHSYNVEWSRTSENHWHECSVCGNKKDVADHAPGEGATETANQICTVCNYVIKTALGHAHNYNIVKTDETYHWNECACGDKMDIATHIWDDGVVVREATYGEPGKKTFTCSVCSRTSVEDIEKLICEETTDFEADIKCDTDTDVEINTNMPPIMDVEPAIKYNKTMLIVLIGGMLGVVWVIVFLMGIICARQASRTRK